MSSSDEESSQESAGLSSDQRKELEQSVANYFLVMECQRKIPVKRGDITKTILKNYGRQFPSVIKSASKILEKLFGYRIVELTTRKSQFILINVLPKADLIMAGQESENTGKDSSRLLLVAVLAGIFMSGGVMAEGTLREYLKRFELDLDSKNEHVAFGNVNKLLHQDWVRQCYLEVSQNNVVDPPVKEYRWGERAMLEVSKRKLLQFVCKVHGNIGLESWPQQLKLVIQDEEGDATMDSD